MDFLRRILGKPAPEQTQETISITKEPVEPPRPPEPVIVAPKAEESNHQKVNTVVVAPTDVTPTVFDTVELGGTRQLPPLEAIVPKPGQHLRVGHLSDVGMVRPNNQDSMFCLVGASASHENLPELGLFVVADGMGGHHDGEKASSIAARVVGQYVINEILLPLMSNQMNDPDRPALTEVLRAAVEKANEAVTEQIPEGGTTTTMAVVLGDLAYFAHVGDSRAYLISNDGIDQITRDHSLVQRLVELDQLTREEMIDHPQKNVLYRAIGQSDNLDVDTITRRLQPRTRLLLCSDGLWNLVADDTIKETVLHEPTPQDACNKLVKLANERGGPDNITVILVQVPG
ncbi:MAG TPA: Stp1/IreP family PP2C-type Ser/Thr phosphatase [Aggregatilineaceae bacterium]|nr:Stp1/IreP family PP2C-type Ser/Thr phosphatase [Aggregatilineaceae bacterium]